MGYRLFALIAARATLEQHFARLEQSPVDLAYPPFALIPLTDELLDRHGFVSPSNSGHFLAAVERVAPQWREARFAFVEANYFGGRGGQGALAFIDGAVTELGNIRDISAGVACWPNSPISAALRMLGIPEDIAGRRDAFDVAGLGAKRDTEDWVT